jgi:uncharacterized membrane protein HdeD (DUF308 family)
VAVSVDQKFPFTKKNWTWFGIGLATIVLGYIILSIPPADGFLSLTLAPVLLVVGYCVLIPIAILIRDDGSSRGNTGTTTT